MMNLQNNSVAIANDVHPRLGAIDWSTVFNVVMAVLPVVLKCLPLLAFAGENPMDTMARAATEPDNHVQLNRHVRHKAHHHGWRDITDGQVQEISDAIMARRNALDAGSLNACCAEAETV